MSITYLVPWRDVIPGEFYERFDRISRSLAMAGSDPEERKIVMDKIKPIEDKDEYLQIRWKMLRCGFEFKQDWDADRWRGWYLPYLDRDELKFMTTATGKVVLIDRAELLSYKTLCGLEDVTAEKMQHHARYLENKYGPAKYEPMKELPEDAGPLEKMLERIMRGMKLGPVKDNQTDFVVEDDAWGY